MKVFIIVLSCLILTSCYGSGSSVNNLVSERSFISNLNDTLIFSNDSLTWKNFPYSTPNIDSGSTVTGSYSYDTIEIVNPEGNGIMFKCINFNVYNEDNKRTIFRFFYEGDFINTSFKYLTNTTDRFVFRYYYYI